MKWRSIFMTSILNSSFWSALKRFMSGLMLSKNAWSGSGWSLLQMVAEEVAGAVIPLSSWTEQLEFPSLFGLCSMEAFVLQFSVSSIACNPSSDNVALCCCCSGSTSGTVLCCVSDSLHCRLTGDRSVRNCLRFAGLFPGISFGSAGSTSSALTSKRKLSSFSYMYEARAISSPLWRSRFTRK